MEKDIEKEENNFLVTLYVDYSILKRKYIDKTFININETKEDIEGNLVTQITRLNISNKILSNTFIIDRENSVKLHFTLINEYNNALLPKNTNIKCWWCRHKFKTSPLGIPIKFLKDTDHNKDKSSDEKFISEGIICSFPCGKSFIRDNDKNIKYKDSMSLLNLLYLKIYGIMINIPYAPSWKLLKSYGGNMSIKEYRESFGYRFFSLMNIVIFPVIMSSSNIIEEKIKE